jgi:anti-anti-sigma factor
MASALDGVRVQGDGETWAVHVHGDVDVDTAPQLQARLDEVLEHGGRVVVLHLDGVDFLDSSGLRVIAHAANQLRDREGQLLLEGASGAVQRTLQITGMIDRLTAPGSDTATPLR